MSYHFGRMAAAATRNWTRTTRESIFEKCLRRSLAAVAAIALLAVALLAGAAGGVTIEMVPVGNPGNPNDDTGYGRVDYCYLIGKYEITNAQWREFLNAKASLDDPYGLYDAEMAGTYGGIDRSGSGTIEDPYVYLPKGGVSSWDRRPVNFVSFWDAARFCNWLHNGQGNGDTES
ncbi:MAG: SUMF1/EgtB/PvdO family nonheme iron enzyme, partial [Pirellulales bacterium]|nr:SUMF1/EgtB/PvdO family nonheme iron enzyme [Pirellulales bacterium]